MEAVPREGPVAGRRIIWVLVGALAATAVILFVANRWWSWATLQSEYLLALLFLALFVISQMARIKVEMQRETFAVFLVEIPLVLGLFYASPQTLLLARVGSSVLFNAARRTPLQKAAFNVVVAGAEVGIAVGVAGAIGLGGISEPATWLATYVGVLTADGVGLLAVLTAIALAQRFPAAAEVRESVASTAVTAVLNTTLGLLIVMTLGVSPWSAVLMLLLFATVLIGYRSYTQYVQQHLRLGELNNLTREVGAGREDGTIGDILLTRARELLNAESATLWLPAQGRFPEVLLTARMSTPGLLDQSSVPGEFRQRAVRTGTTVAVGRRLGYTEWSGVGPVSGVKDIIVVPLRSGSAVIGCIEVANRLGDLEWFRREDVQLLETLAAHAAVAVENSRLVDRLRFDAYHDALTGLPNRRRMTMALEEAVKIKAPGEVVALLLFDVDGMRDVNDSLGHAAGDKLLVEVARRLTALSPPGALVARVGGDEFVVMLRLPDGEAAVALASKIRVALQEPLGLGSLTLDVDTVAGIALHPDHGTEPETLLQRADLATYAAKSVTSGVRKFNLGMESRSVRRLGLAGDLRRALDADEIDVYFQPKVGLESRELVGVECLVRWEHPAHGSVAPEDFVAVAEHTGQLGRLTEVVLRAGLRRCRQWADDGRPLSVAVNLSPRTLVDPEFPGRVEVLLEEYGVTPARLTLEITEDGVLGETDRPLPTLHRLCDLGVRLSVDDFGTGYSSLSYLRRLPVHEVKVDRTFVQGMATDPGDLAIVRAVVDLSRHFGLDVVAEGVESELTLSLLEDMGCDIGQGFLFSRPLPYERLEAWFAAQTEPQTTPTGEIRKLRLVP